jgi:hypothetical protein
VVGTGEEAGSSGVAEVRRVVETRVVVKSDVVERMGSTIGVVWVVMEMEEEDEDKDEDEDEERGVSEASGVLAE